MIYFLQKKGDSCIFVGVKTTVCVPNGKWRIDASEEFEGVKSGEFSKILWGRSSVWLERLPVTQEVASSSLVGPASNS